MLLHRTHIALSLGLLLNAGSAVAQIGVELPSGFGLTPGQWVVGNNMASANTYIDGIERDSDRFHLVPRPDELNFAVQAAQSFGSKTAAASAGVSAISLGAAASALDPLNPNSTFTAALGHASLMYVAVLDTQVSVRFDFKLNGTLAVNGARSFGSDASGAAVAMFALGSMANATQEQNDALFANAGINPAAEGDAMLAQLKAWPTSTQTHLATFGAQASTSQPLVSVDETLQVTAQGMRIDCELGLAPVCGRYLYFAAVSLFALAQNGGLADFSHTLQVTGISIDGGAAQPFNPLSPVPEPASLALILGGLLMLGGLKARRTFQG